MLRIPDTFGKEWLFIMIFSILCAFSTASIADSHPDHIYPPGYDITAEYQPDSDEVFLGDTLTITWSITNNEDFSLSDLYLADNSPPECRILSSEISVGGRPLSFYFSGPLSDQILPGYDTYRWVIDFPGEPDSLGNYLPPGRTLTLTRDVLFEDPGRYQLPLHIICFYGDSTGFFAIGAPLSLKVHPVIEIPTLTEWGLMILGLILIAVMSIALILRLMDIRT
jgi:hypothetical protein